jgi:hypothetical protein
MTLPGPAWDFQPNGDTEAAVRDILANDTPELPHFPPNPPLTITTNLIGFVPEQRWIVISQEGGSMQWPKIFRCRVDVEVFAERRSVAREISEIALASIFRQTGIYRGYGVFISDVTLEQGITRIPDKLQGVSRYVFAVRLTTVPDALSPQMVPYS